MKTLFKQISIIFWQLKPKHTCKYCGVKTKQSDNVCWNNPKNK
jgi:hypothetical protein